MKISHGRLPTMRRISIAALLCLFAFPALARVISYSPYTDRTALPAHQHRMNRYFALVEGATAMGGGGGTSPVPPFMAPGFSGQLVVYDFLGLEEPKVVYPREGLSSFSAVAVREDSKGVPSLLALVAENNQTSPFF